MPRRVGVAALLASLRIKSASFCEFQLENQQAAQGVAILDDPPIHRCIRRTL